MPGLEVVGGYRSTNIRREDVAREEGRKIYGMCLAVLLLLVLGMLAYLWGISKTMRQAEELSQLRRERQALVSEQERLRAEITGLMRSSRIKTIAAEKLGMQFPYEPPRNLYLKTAESRIPKAKN